MFMIEKFGHDIIFSVTGKVYIVDTCKCPDTRKWETGITEINLDAIHKAFDLEEGEELTKDEILDAAEEWEFQEGIEITEHKNKAQAEKFHKKMCASL